jgi:hypothetical protein
MLTFIKYTGTKNSNGNKLAEFICKCGNISIYSKTRVKNGYISKCKKCAALEAKIKHSTHGMKYSDEYRIWGNIKTRCLNKNSKDYARYGGRGISIYKKWKNSFESFFDYIGKRPSKQHSIDRIDNNKGYEPGNIRWATLTEQHRNKRNSVYVTDGTNVYHIKEVAIKLGITNGAAHQRLKRGKLHGFTKNT